MNYNKKLTKNNKILNIFMKKLVSLINKLNKFHNKLLIKKKIFCNNNIT